MSSLLEVRCRSLDTAVVVTVMGELDMTSVSQLEHVLMSAMDEARPCRDLVVDLTGTSYVDSSGLGLLSACHQRGTGEGVRLRVVAPARAVLRPIQLTGLDETLLLYADVFDAVDAGQEGSHR
ncbi:MAG TPA: STAS domain-containing protein [Umezawaea sp.]|nr:STAS domain-containing protein [Umezawaea sp.]